MKKYIRTKDGRIAEIKDNMFVIKGDVSRLVYKGKPYICVLPGNDEIIKQADNIEDLCDEFVIAYLDGFHQLTSFPSSLEVILGHSVYGAVWTDDGLKYVAKMNKNGELELL